MSAASQRARGDKPAYTLPPAVCGSIQATFPLVGRTRLELTWHLASSWVDRPFFSITVYNIARAGGRRTRQEIAFSSTSNLRHVYVESLSGEEPRLYIIGGATIYLPFKTSVQVGKFLDALRKHLAAACDTNASERVDEANAVSVPRGGDVADFTGALQAAGEPGSAIAKPPTSSMCGEPA